MVNLHIIGAQKCGTTALAQFLHQHPDIYVVDGKEAHVFDHPKFLSSPQKMEFAKKAFSGLTQEYKNEQYVCDATPITMFSKQFIHHCYAFNPNAKFIVLLRDPVARAQSHYIMSREKGLETKSMLAAFVQEGARLEKADGNWSMRSPLRTQSYLARGRYTRQLSALYDLVPREQVLVLHQEDLHQNHQSTLKQVFAFLDIPEHEIPSEQVFAGKPQALGMAERLNRGIARLFARAYFRRLGENKANWQKTIANS